MKDLQDIFEDLEFAKMIYHQTRRRVEEPHKRKKLKMNLETAESNAFLDKLSQLETDKHSQKIKKIKEALWLKIGE